MTLLDFIIWVLLVALAVNFTRTLMGKWGVTEWLLVHTGGLLHKMLSCDFCTSFWIGVVYSIILAAIVSPWLVLVPFFSCNLR